MLPRRESPPRAARGEAAPAAAGNPRRPWSSACRRSGRAAAAPAPWPSRAACARQRYAAILVVAAVEPELASPAAGLDQRPARQLLQAAPASRPARPLPIARRRSELAAPADARCRRPPSPALSIWWAPTSAGGGRSTVRAVAVVAEARAAVGVDLPFAAHAEQRRAELAAAPRDHRGARLALAADHRRHAALHDAGLLAGDLRQRVAQEAACGR